MDSRRLASYAYHNCEFLQAIRHAQESPSSEDIAAVHVKALSELDDKQSAVRFAETYATAFPGSGMLHYLRGMSYYLAGMPRARIESAFLSAAEYNYAGGNMGLAFIEFANQRLESATRLLAQADCICLELDHVRRMMLFQVLASDQRLTEAEEQLRIGDRVLARAPSLLRHHWGQLCWVRLFMARGLFEGARALLDRIMGELDEASCPRLYRNAREAGRMIEIQDVSPNITLPPERGPGAEPDALSRITRKPMLHSLYTYLTTKGGKGASKEDIVENVWEESYNPVIHDDRIYKAVGRLRKLLGDDLAAPRHLTQVGRQYILNLPGRRDSPGETT